MKLIDEFKDFLKEYKILALAIAFIIGAAATTMVQATVNDIIMPIVTFFIPGGEWKNSVFTLGSIVIKWGDFLSALINFLIIAFTVFIIAKIIMRDGKAAKK